MFDWLFEGRTAVYCLIGVVAVLLLLVWWQTRKRNFLLAALAVAALAGVYFLLSKVVETPRAQVERKVHEMADAFKARDTEGVFKHIAKDFKFRSLDRTQSRALVENVLKLGTIEEVVIYDEEWPDGGDRRTIPVEFRVKPKGAGLENYGSFPVKARFVREDDGQWRMQSCEIYDPVLNKQPLTIPLMP